MYVSFQKYRLLSIFPLVQVFLYQNDSHFMLVEVQFSDFYKNVTKQIIQWSSEVCHKFTFKK